MPKRIMKVFESLGFYWGGYYGDYMHFEYERSSIILISDELPPEVLYPLSADIQRESPLKYFFLNEDGAGGYFPLGRQQNLLAGVHLEPDSREALVPSTSRTWATKRKAATSSAGSSGGGARKGASRMASPITRPTPGPPAEAFST